MSNKKVRGQMSAILRYAKGKLMRNWFFIAASMLLASCASVPHGASLVDEPADLPSIQAKHADKLTKLRMGMSLDDFRAVFPESYVGGQNEETTAYEIVNLQKYVTQGDIDRQNFWWGAGSPNARSAKQILWFYFYKDQLVRWGRPQDWPSNPDVVIEKRQR